MIERAFVAIWPSSSVIRRLSRLPRPDEPGVRWVPPEEWHVTLRFLGRVEHAEVAAALDDAGLGGVPAPTVELGPAVSRWGRSVLCVPASGLDRLAGVVRRATAGVGEPADPRPFAGHLTLGRVRGRGTCGLAGYRVAARFEATAVELVASTRTGGRPRYERLGAWTLGPSEGA